MRVFTSLAVAGVTVARPLLTVGVRRDAGVDFPLTLSAVPLFKLVSVRLSEIAVEPFIIDIGARRSLVVCPVVKPLPAGLFKGVRLLRRGATDEP